MLICHCLAFGAETLAGITKLHRLEENIGVIEVNLTPHDFQRIEETASKIKVQGARYPEKTAKLVNR